MRLLLPKGRGSRFSSLGLFGVLRVVGGADPYGLGAGGLIVDGRLTEERAHSSSTAARSPFSNRRRQGCGAEGEIADGRSAGEWASRVVGGADTCGAGSGGYVDGRSVGRRQEQAGGANMPSPVGEGGSRRLTDEAFFPRSRFCCKVTHYSSSTAPRSPFSHRRRQRA